MRRSRRSESDQALIANAQTRWQNSVAGLQDALRVQATVVGNLDTHRKEMSALVSSSQGATGALQASQAGNQLLGLQAQQLADLDGSSCRAGTGAKSRNCPAYRRAGPGQGAASSLSRTRSWLSAFDSSDVSPMSGRGGLKRVMLVTTAAAVPILVVAACTIQLRGDSDGPPARSSASRATSPLGGELERCRKVTSEQVAELQECRLIWAENRRRFLGSKKTPGVTSADAQPGSPTPSLAQPKHPDRLPQGWPPVATPERE